MRRFFSALTMLGFLLALAMGLPATADASKAFWVGVVDELGNAIASGVTCRVITTGQVGADATIYTNAGLGTASSNPITADAQGVCKWFGGDSTTTYDVIVYHQRGIARLEAVTDGDHRVVVNRMHPYKQVVFAFSGAGAGAEVDTGIDLPEGAMVVDIVIETITGNYNGTDGLISVGLKNMEGGDPTGFCSGCRASPAGTSSASPGFFRASSSVTADSTWGQYISTNTRGSYLLKASMGKGPYPGVAVESFYVIPKGGPKSIVYYTTTAYTTLAGYVHLMYLEVANR